MLDRRPLYLLAEQRIAVEFAAPALRVAAAERAPTFHPLAQLSRVLSRGRVDWAGDALAACLEAGVPVLFVGDHGRLRGVLSLARSDPSGLGEYLRCAAQSPDWPEHYSNWHRGQQRRLIARLCAALGWPEPDVRPEVVRQQLDQALERCWQRSPQRLLEPYVPLLRAGVTAELAAAGIDPGMSAGAWGGVDLGRDLAGLAIWPLRGRLLAAHRAPPDEPAAAIAHYEQQLAQPMTRTIARLISYLWRIPL